MSLTPRRIALMCEFMPRPCASVRASLVTSRSVLVPTVVSPFLRQGLMMTLSLGSRHQPFTLPIQRCIEAPGSADFDDAVDRSTDGGAPYGRGDIIRRHGLEQHGCQADGIAVGRGVRDALDELEELRRVNDRVRNRRSLDQRFLSDLRSEVPALCQAVGAHDRQGNVMPNACRRFCGLEVAR